ncbi:DNA-directed RNA polymerase I subunit rpa49 [Chytriomyces hyalinus]|nr:DNA-directed RNA polymerase I subunit rpa49 [Chytriomyces hyalinus]
MKFKAIKGSENPPFCASFADELNGLNNAHFHSFVQALPPASSGLPQGNAGRIVVAGLDRVEVRAETQEAAPPLVKYVVGVVDKSKGTIRFCQAPQILFKTIVKSRSQFKPSLLGAKSTLARNALGETFGTIKRKQAIKATERNKVKMDSLMDAEQVIKNAIDDTSALVPTLEDLKEEQEANRLIPPFNMAATSPADVYDLESIMSHSDYTSIDVSKLTQIKFKEDLQQELNSVFPSNWVLVQTVGCMGGKADITRLQQIMYILYMMKFLSFRDSALSKKKGSPMSDLPPQVAASLIEMFTVEQISRGRMQRVFPDRMKDKLKSYILAACLILDGFRIDMTMLGRDLGLTGPKMSTYCRELGCVTDAGKGADKDSRFAVLKTPLKFPVKSLGRR